MKLALEISREELSNLQTSVIVENWDKVKESGSKKRRWLAEFTEPERKYLSAMYKHFYRWYLVTGYPEYFIFRDIKNIDLIQRATNFFAAI